MKRNSMKMEQHGLTDYQTEWNAMRAYTDSRTVESPDVFWLTQHYPVYTLGLNIKPENHPWQASWPLKNTSVASPIPVVQTDRGGQVTYHGPGQCIVYCLVDLKRQTFGIKEFVARLERGTLLFLEQCGIQGHLVPGAPGVYVEGAKIAALGLKVRRGCTYHGLSLNVEMDLSPFSAIHPCGYKGLNVTQLRDHGVLASMEALHSQLAECLAERLGVL
jgi:lipoyl(octanoyl) transferase